MAKWVQRVSTKLAFCVAILNRVLINIRILFAGDAKDIPAMRLLRALPAPARPTTGCAHPPQTPSPRGGKQQGQVDGRHREAGVRVSSADWFKAGVARQRVGPTSSGIAPRAYTILNRVLLLHAVGGIYLERLRLMN